MAAKNWECGGQETLTQQVRIMAQVYVNIKKIRVSRAWLCLWANFLIFKCPEATNKRRAHGVVTAV